MTIHTPLRCSNSGMVSYGSGGAGKIILLNPGNYPSFKDFGNLSYIWNGTNGSGDWTQLNPTATLVDSTGPLGPALNGVKLSGRTAQVMANDGTFVMVYGGAGSSSLAGVFQDTWLFNTSTNVWTLASPATTPYGRYNAEGANLTGGGVVMFGGEIVGQILNETWQWNGSTWSQVSVPNGTGPAGRIGHCLVNGSTKVLLFGGRGNNSQFNDTWIYTSAGGWVNLNITGAAAPSVRDGAAMCYDSVNNVWVMFGGQNEYNYLPETWTFNGTAWTKVTPTGGVAPAARIGAMMAFDTVSGTSIMYGGISATTMYPVNETWSFNAANSTWVLK